MIRLLLAIGIATVVSSAGTRLLITALTNRRIGQPIHEDVPEGHTVKAGTPTMGGLAIVAGAVAGTATAIAGIAATVRPTAATTSASRRSTRTTA